MGNPGVVRMCGYAMWHIGDVNGRWECKRPQHVDVFQGSFPLERTWYNTQPCEDKKLRPSHLLKRNLIYQIYWSDNSGLEEAFLERENLTQGTSWKCYCLSWCCLSQKSNQCPTAQHCITQVPSDTFDNWEGEGAIISCSLQNVR